MGDLINYSKNSFHYNRTDRSQNLNVFGKIIENIFTLTINGHLQAFFRGCSEKNSKNLLTYIKVGLYPLWWGIFKNPFQLYKGMFFRKT